MEPGTAASTKRKRMGQAEEPGVGRRQPRTSCDFCRLKKLKCNRMQPCSSCVSHGVECRGEPSPPGLATSASVHPSANQDLVLRVRRLEQAVFGTIDAGTTASSGNKSQCDSDASQPALRRSMNQGVPITDSCTKDDPPNRDHSGNFIFCIRPSEGADNSWENVAPLHDGADVLRTVSLPLREDAFALLDDYVENYLALNRVISETSARALIHDVYSRLARGQEVKNDHIAFTLAICADSAFNWNQEASRLVIFESEDEAARQSFHWRKIIWDLLDHSQRAGGSSLEGVQARMILQDMIYNQEGGSARWRYLLSSTLASARELFLHLIDSPAYENKDDSSTREIKRRVWWHLVSTDWLASCASGLLDRIYTVNPQHMAVHYPRNINDSDLPVCDRQPAIPIDVATEMSYFIARIRLAEVCREVADLLTMSPGVTDIDHLRFEQVLRIDRLTEELRDLFPPPCTLHAPLPPDAPSQIRLQRQVINLALEARRARLFRPFVQSNITTDRDHRFLRFRTACLRSAVAVVDIASGYLAGMVRDPEQPGRASAGHQRSSRPPLPRYSAIVIHHLFQACVVLAADPCLGGNNLSRLPEVESRRKTLAKASRLLERVSEQSLMAADLVGKLISILKRYCVQGVETGSSILRQEASHSTATAVVNERTEQHPSVVDQPPGIALTTAPLVLPTQHIDGITWGGLEFGGFEGLWDNLIENPSVSDDWGQVFIDLDHLSGPL